MRYVLAVFQLRYVIILIVAAICILAFLDKYVPFLDPIFDVGSDPAELLFDTNIVFSEEAIQEMRAHDRYVMSVGRDPSGLDSIMARLEKLLPYLDSLERGLFREPINERESLTGVGDSIPILPKQIPTSAFR